MNGPGLQHIADALEGEIPGGSQIAAWALSLRKIAGETHLRYVEYVAHLCKVWWHIFSSGKCKELIKLFESLNKLERSEKRAYAWHHFPEPAVPRLLSVFHNPPLHLLHDLFTCVSVVHCKEKLYHLVLFLQMTLAAQDSSV